MSQSQQNRPGQGQQKSGGFQPGKPNQPGKPGQTGQFGEKGKK